MSKRVWISFPLTTSSAVSDPAVVSFLKGGQKKELEVEIATFITKWLLDKGVPFEIEFAASTVDRSVVMAALPKRLQKILGVTSPAGAGSGDGRQVEVLHVEEADAIEDAGEIEPLEVEQEAEVAETETEDEDEDPGDPPELR